MKYTDLEKKYINGEFRDLQTARQEKIPDDTLRRWVIDFQDLSYPAETACRMIRLARLKKIDFKIKFSDLTGLLPESRDMDNIIPIKQLLLETPEAKSLEEKSIERASNMLTRVRTELGMSFIVFITEADSKGFSWMQYFDYLKSNPEKISKREAKEFNKLSELF